MAEKKSNFLYTLQPHSVMFKKLRPTNERFNKQGNSSSRVNHSPIMKAKDNFDEFYNSIAKASHPETSSEDISLSGVVELRKFIESSDVARLDEE